MEQRLCSHDKIILERMKPFARFMKPTDWEAILRGLRNEGKLRSQLAFWIRQKLFGITTLEEAAILCIAVEREEV